MEPSKKDSSIAISEWMKVQTEESIALALVLCRSMVGHFNLVVPVSVPFYFRSFVLTFLSAVQNTGVS